MGWLLLLRSRSLLLLLIASSLIYGCYGIESINNEHVVVVKQQRNLQDDNIATACLNTITDTLVVALQATLSSYSVAIQLDAAQIIAKQLVNILSPEQTKTIIELAVNELPPGTPVTEIIGNSEALVGFFQNVADGTFNELALNVDQLVAVVLENVDTLSETDQANLAIDLLVTLTGGVNNLDTTINNNTELQDDATNLINGLNNECPFIQSTGGTDFPTSSPTVSPTSAPTDDNDDGGGRGGILAFFDNICFSGNNKVDVKGKGMIPINELQIGDYVKSSNTFNNNNNIKDDINDNDYYTRVISFAHKDNNKRARFLQIFTSHENNYALLPIEISLHHMIQKSDTSMVRAKDLQIGDILDGEFRIVHIEIVNNKIGLYAPITETGTIVVSGLTASSYVALLQHYDIPAHVQHYIAHAFFAPIRILCNINFDIFCMKEQYIDEGLPNFLNAWKRFGMYITQHHNVLFQFISALVVAIIIFIFYVTEQILLHGSVVSLILSMIAGFVVFKTSKQNRNKKTVVGKLLHQ